MNLYGEVRRVERLSPSMLRVVLGGEGLDGYVDVPETDKYVNALFFAPGAERDVPFDLDAGGAGSAPRPYGRRYTIRWWDPQRRELAIDFVVHGDEGYAGAWAQRAGPGDRLQLVGPAGGYRPSPAADWFLMVGDESALPAIGASLEAVPPGRPVIGVVIVDGPDHELALSTPGDLDLRWIHRTGGPDDHELLVQQVGRLRFPEGSGSLFVHGEAGEVRSVRRHLLGDRGIDHLQTSISPYWRRHHTDERWRAVKARFVAEMELDVA